MIVTTVPEIAHNTLLISKILNLPEPLSLEDQHQLLNQLQSAAEKIGHEIQNPRHRG